MEEGEEAYSQEPGLDPSRGFEKSNMCRSPGDLTAAPPRGDDGGERRPGFE